MMPPTQLTHFLDQEHAWQRQMINKVGWAIEYILGDDEGPPFAYTVGLSAREHPDLILFGAPQEIAMGFRNELGGRVKACPGLPRDRPIGVFPLEAGCAIPPYLRPLIGNPPAPRSAAQERNVAP